jgi:opacity protein-like surface antigen
VDDVGQFFGSIDNNNFGFDVGGGLMGFFTDNVGLRGDIRFFRSLDNNDNGVDVALGDFRFWRGTVGVTFRF